MDNIFRVYSRQFSRGGVALIAVVHRSFAFAPPPSLTHSLSLSPFLYTAVFSSFSSPSAFSSPDLVIFLFRCLHYHYRLYLLPPVHLFYFCYVHRVHLLLPVVRFRVVRQYTATLAGLICAQQERHELMHVAHAGRESVGSLSSRTPALTRIHHRATLRRAHFALNLFLGQSSRTLGICMCARYTRYRMDRAIEKCTLLRFTGSSVQRYNAIAALLSNKMNF